MLRSCCTFFLLICSLLAQAQSPTDLAEEIFDNLIAKDSKSLRFYLLDYTTSENIFMDFHEVDTTVFEGSMYAVVKSEHGSAFDVFMKKDFVQASAKIKSITVDEKPEILSLAAHGITLKDVARDNNEGAYLTTNILFENEGKELLLRLPFVKSNGYYYLVSWSDFFPQLSQSTVPNKPITKGRIYKTEIPLISDLIWDISTNQLITFNKHTYLSDVLHLGAAIGVEVDPFELNNMLSYNGEKGRFGYLKVDQPFDKIRYKDVKDISCDIRYLNDVLELGAFLFKDPQGYFYKFEIDQKASNEAVLILNYARLN